MFYSGKVDHDHDEKIIVVIICLYHKSELEGKFYNSQYRNNYDTKTLCLFDISEVHFVTLKALSLALVLPCRTALVIACLNELTLLSPREGDPQHFHPPAGEGTPALLSEALMTAPFQGLLCNFRVVSTNAESFRDHTEVLQNGQSLFSFSPEILSVFSFSSTLEYGRQQVVIVPRWRSET